MQKDPKESGPKEIEEQAAAPSAFKQEMAFVIDAEQARRYAGCWVALDGDQVLAVGPRPKGVLAEAGTHGHDDPVLHYFPLRDPDTMFCGGW